MRTLRIAIVGDSPCGLCRAACCKQNGHEYAAMLRGHEVRKFAALAVDVTIREGERLVSERVLPYVDGRCQFLGEDDRCTIYDDRPSACRAFQCVEHFNPRGVGAHGPFLERNVTVLTILEMM